MILSVAIVTGFQSEIRTKVVGFGSHIQITSSALNSSQESTPVKIKQPFYPGLDSLDGVRHIQIYATKPGIVETDEEIHGIIVKGIGPDFDWNFFKNDKFEGETLSLSDTATSNSIVVSRKLAEKLKLKIDDRLIIYLIQRGEEPRPRKLKISGIYETGLAEFDEQFVLADIRHLQRINKWGVRAAFEIPDTCAGGRFILVGKGISNNAMLKYSWNGGEWTQDNTKIICIEQDTTIRLAVAHQNDAASDEISIHFEAPKGSTGCQCSENLTYTIEGGKGSQYDFVGGFEVLLDSYSDLVEIDDKIFRAIPYDLSTTTITDEFSEIFSWLQMQDINVQIIIILMILVAGINMISALIVLILERTTMIGILKALGSNNASIQSVFLYNAAFLTGRGLLLGNIMGIGLCLLQQYTGLITLPEETYYVSVVPVNISFLHILLLNAGTLTACVLMLIVPTFIVAKISPVRAIRFT